MVITAIGDVAGNCIGVPVSKPLSTLSAFKLTPEQALKYLPLLRALESAEHPTPPTMPAVYAQLGPVAMKAVHESLPDHSVIVKWSARDAYAEIQVHQSGMYEWFMRDRVMDSHDGSTDAMSGLLPAVLLSFLQEHFADRVQNP